MERARIPSESFEATLEDGTPILFRPITPDDKERLQAGFERLSPESRYRRFFRAIDEFTKADLRYLTEIDYQDHFAWVATLPEEPGEPGVGVGRWVRLEPGLPLAEAAITVIDDFQHLGIGKTLLRLAAHSALSCGISAFRVWVLSENEPVLHLLQEFGARPGVWERGVMEVTVPLPPSIDLLEGSPAPLILRAVASSDVDASVASSGPAPVLRLRDQRADDRDDR